AQFMEGIELTARGARLGELRLEAEELQGMLDGKRVDLRKISRISYKDFYDGGGSDRGRSDNYTLAWAFVYYLRKGAGSDANSPFARIIPRYEAAIRAGQSGEDATPLAFEGIDFDALTEDFIAFWTSSSRRSAAQRMEIAALCPTP
ncbi:MAG: hypothetical protein U1E27_11830, partial [Kiritimatiellia bacterium]|nr:hypothetical protein [Kiritimatiellia bacterium]